MSHTFNHTTILSGVYSITCLNTLKVYIGSAVDIKRRWNWHKTALRRSQHHSILLQRAWHKYGEHEFVFLVLELCPPQNVVTREQAWLDALAPYNPQRGYNIAKDANAPSKGRKHTAEHKAKIGVASLGRHRTEEEKAKISAAHKGRKHTAAARANMSAAQVGKTHTAEHKAKIGAASREAWQKPEYREKLMKRLQNPSPDTRAKISAALTGRACTPEAKAKIAAKNSLAYVVTAPDGTEITVQNLTQFCRDHGLSPANLGATSRGLRNHHKGWKCRKIE